MTWIIETFRTIWWVSLSNHFCTLEYEFCRVCTYAYVRVRACGHPWVCLDSKRWIRFQTSQLSKIECTRTACFKVKTTPLWFTLRDEYRKFCEFPMGLLTHMVNAFWQSTNKWCHNWLCEPRVWIRCTVLNTFFFSARQVWRQVSRLLGFQTGEKVDQGSGKASSWLPRAIKRWDYLDEWLSKYGPA